jgi:cytochrome c556
MRPLTLFAFLLGISACANGRPHGPPQQAQLTRAVSPPARLQPPEDLPPSSREVLRTLMASHARNMGDLMESIMVLDYPRIHAGARAIIGEASVARPVSQDATELNAQLPAKFFELQDALRAEAKVLAATAEAMDPFKVAESYGRLSETCVRCHAVYRAGRPSLR